MRVYHWKQLKIELALAAGGSLAADTTYYVFGWLQSKYEISMYMDGVGPISEIKNITTTPTEKTINISWWIEGEITGFEDAGGGQVRVLSADHRLDTGNKMTIQTGAYAGEYTITREDYDSFLITAAFAGSYETTWKNASFSGGINNANGIKIWLHTTNPEAADGTFAGTATYASPVYYANGYTANPVVFTSVLGPSGTVFMPWIEKRGIEFNFIKEKGLPIYYFPEETLNIDAMRAEILAAGEMEHNEVNTRRITLFGHFLAKVATTTLTGIQIVIYAGDCLLNNMTLIRSSFQMRWGHIRSHVQFNMIDTVFHNDWTSISDNIPRITSGSNKHFVNFNLYLNGSNIWDGYHFVLISSSPAQFQVPYPHGTAAWKNGSLRNGFIYYLTQQIPPDPEHRYFDSLYLETNTSYDIRNYNYNHNGLVFKFDNIDTNREGNLKKVYYNSPGKYSHFYFYRKGTISIKEGDSTIQGAALKITDGVGNSYEYTTDESGEIFFIILEQTSIPPPTLTGSGYATNTLITGFTLTIQKSGYYPLIITTDDARDFIKEFQIKQIENIYIDRRISGTIPGRAVAGSLQVQSLTGRIQPTQQITGTITKRDLEGKIETEEITGTI